MELQTKLSNVSKLFISNSLEVKEEFEEVSGEMNGFGGNID